MCGIFGTIDYPLSHKKETILGALRHRGPDEQRFMACTGGVELYHARLAIQDLSPAGRQPMEHRGNFIAFNGEIYNHRDILKKYGLENPSRSDTLSILLLYEVLGMKVLDEFDGMFAFVLYDSNKRKVFLARDRAGKKPLYIWNRGGRYVFSSELGVLHKVMRSGLNQESISDFLYLGFNYQTTTPYEDIRELGNGSFVEIDLTSGKSTEQKWFNMAAYYEQPNALKEEEALLRLDGYLQASVKRRLDSSDLEVGAFLSGGIDSGLVTAIASGASRNFRTFTVKLPGAYDEAGLAAAVAARYGTRHAVIDISFDHLRDDLTGIIANYGEPFFDSSAIPSYYVSREAKKHITVVLNGDGADELFGGYRRYVPFRYFDFFQPGRLSSGLARGLGRVLPAAHEKKSLYNYLYRLLRFAGSTDLVEMYTGATTDVFTGFSEAFSKPPRLTALRQMLESVGQMDISPLKKILLADFEALLFGDLLPKMDIATMAVSLEGRSPFLSKELLEFAPGLQDDYKIRKGQTKYLLRRLAERYLPPEIIRQPKRGFEVPLKQWMDGALKDIAQDYLLGNAGALYPGFIRKSFVEDLWNRKMGHLSDEKRAKMLYALLCLEIWNKKVYLDA